MDNQYARVTRSNANESAAGNSSLTAAQLAFAQALGSVLAAAWEFEPSSRPQPAPQVGQSSSAPAGRPRPKKNL